MADTMNERDDDTILCMSIYLECLEFKKSMNSEYTL